jgi:redox-sensing transcriptional repressor
VRRLSAYYRALGAIADQGVLHVSSKGLSDLAGSTAPQVRRDLAYFGSFGTRGVGYSVASLRTQLAGILGIDRAWSLGLVGVGHLGQALLAYREFQGAEYEIAAAFDIDSSKIGSVVSGIRISDFASFRTEARQLKLAIVMVAVPAAVAQEVVDQIVAADVRAILNFAPVQLHVPDDVRLASVDLSMEVESLTHSLMD